MDIQIITQAGTQLGFPIVCCGAMMWYGKYTTDKNREEVDKLNDQHRQEMTDMTAALNTNTVVHTRLCEILKSGDE